MTPTFNFLAMVFFLIGSALHTLAQIDAIARSKQASRIAILKEVWITILTRDGWCIAFFVLWLQGQLVAMLTALKIPLPDMALTVLDLHVGSAIAWMAGYTFDSALSFIPGLKSTVPAPIDVPSSSGKP